MASWALHEEADDPATPSLPTRDELERLRAAAGLAISPTGTARRRPRDDSGHEESLQADRGSSPPHIWGSCERAGQLLWLLSVLGLSALAWLPLVAALVPLAV